MLSYETAFIVIMTGIAIAVLGRFFGLRPALLAGSGWPDGIRFTEAEMAAVAATLRFHGLLILVTGIAIAVAVTVIG